MERRPRNGEARRAGQAMVEYVLALAILLAAACAVFWLRDALRSDGDRTLDLVSSEYP